MEQSRETKAPSIRELIEEFGPFGGVTGPAYRLVDGKIEQVPESEQKTTWLGGLSHLNDE